MFPALRPVVSSELRLRLRLRPRFALVGRGLGLGRRLLGEAGAVKQHRRDQIVPGELAPILAQEPDQAKAVVLLPVSGGSSALFEGIQLRKQPVAAGERGLELQHQEFGMARAALFFREQYASRAKGVLEQVLAELGNLLLERDALLRAAGGACGVRAAPPRRSGCGWKSTMRERRLTNSASTSLRG